MTIYRKLYPLLINVLCILVVMLPYAHVVYAQELAEKPPQQAAQQVSAADFGITKILLDVQGRDSTFQFIWNLAEQESAGDSLSEKMAVPITITLTLSDPQGRTLSKSVTLDAERPINSPSQAQNIHIPVSQPAAEEPVNVSILSKEATDIPAQQMVLVQSGTYTMSGYLKRYIRYLDAEVVTIETPFSIQAGEVTVGEFRRYVEDLDAEQRQAIGTRWEKSAEGTPYPEEQPVENVSWQDAQAYTTWLSAKSGWDLRLLTVEQWAAACTHYAESRPVLFTDTNHPLAEIQGTIDHLLGNLREWSATPCDNGRYRVLGENYMTDNLEPQVVGAGHCVGADEQWTGLGFRLVRIEQK